MAKRIPKRIDVKLDEWDDAFKLAGELSKDRDAQWFFRGHSDEEWHLKSSLERAAEHYRTNKPECLNRLHGLGDVERRVLIAFHRAAWVHHVDIREENYLGWLAMIQHHGGPARLLDFTRAFWIGVFFAIQPTVHGWPKRKKDADKTKKDKKDADKTNEDEEGPFKNNVVWAIQSRKLWDKAMDTLGPPWEKFDKEPPWEEFDKDIPADRRWAARKQCAEKIGLGKDWKKKGDVAADKPVLALPLESEQMNERMLAQRGCFIFPLAVERSFEENLYGTFGIEVPDKYPDRDNVQAFRAMKSNGNFPLIMRILLPRKKKRGYRILEDMNITAATLFPGRDGLASSTYRTVWNDALDEED